MKLDGLRLLKPVVEGSTGETLTAALACLRNLSINKANEVRSQNLYFALELTPNSLHPDVFVHFLLDKSFVFYIIYTL